MKSISGRAKPSDGGLSLKIERDETVSEQSHVGYESMRPRMIPGNESDEVQAGGPVNLKDVQKECDRPADQPKTRPVQTTKLILA